MDIPWTCFYFLECCWYIYPENKKCLIINKAKLRDKRKKKNLMWEPLYFVLSPLPPFQLHIGNEKRAARSCCAPFYPRGCMLLLYFVRCYNPFQSYPPSTSIPHLDFVMVTFSWEVLWCISSSNQLRPSLWFPSIPRCSVCPPYERRGRIVFTNGLLFYLAFSSYDSSNSFSDF